MSIRIFNIDLLALLGSLPNPKRCFLERVSGTCIVLVSPCELNLTPEHAMQITPWGLSGLSKQDCLAAAVQREPRIDSVVYCPEQAFCGYGVEPHKTANLSSWSVKNCEMFVENVNSCTQLENDIVQFG